METNKLQTIKNIEVSLMTKFMMQDPECIPEKYHGSLDEFLSDIRKNKWAELFLNMYPDKVSNNNYWFELQEFFTEKMSSMLEKQEKSKPFVSFTTEEEFMDFLDDYSIFVSLCEKYKAKGLIAPSAASLRSVRGELVFLSKKLAEKVNDSNEEMDKYDQNAENIFRDYLKQKDWLLEKDDPSYCFAKQEWHITDIVEAVDLLKPGTYNVPENCKDLVFDYEDVSNYISEHTFNRSHEENIEVIYESLKQYLGTHKVLSVGEAGVRFLYQIVMCKDVNSQNGLYKFFLEMHHIDHLSLNQLMIILDRHADFCYLNCMNTIKKLSEIKISVKEDN